MVGTEQRKTAQRLKPILSIGKNGVTDGSLALIDRELEQKSLIKIKVLKSAPKDKKETAEEVIAKLNCELVQIVGNVFVLYRKPR